MKSALIVDDHPVVRAAVKIVLEQEGFERIYEVASGSEVMAMVREYSPDLVVLDLVMPSPDGLDVLGRMKIANVASTVLVFTSQEPQFYQERCMRAGAMAYVPKTNDLSHLHKAVHALMAGYTYFIQLASSSMALNNLQSSEKELIDKLSDRELMIFQHLARGLSNKAIAEAMHLSHKTVSTYKTRCNKKLRLTSAVHCREFAKRNHLI